MKHCSEHDNYHENDTPCGLCVNNPSPTVKLSAPEAFDAAPGSANLNELKRRMETARASWDRIPDECDMDTVECERRRKRMVESKLRYHIALNSPNDPSSATARANPHSTNILMGHDIYCQYPSRKCICHCAPVNNLPPKLTATKSETFDCSALLGFLRGKLHEAESCMRSREDMAASLEKSIDWEELAKMPGVIITKTCRGRKPPTEKQNKESAKSQRRIAAIYLNEAEMFKAAIDAIEKPNDPSSATAS